MGVSITNAHPLLLTSKGLEAMPKKKQTNEHEVLGRKLDHCEIVQFPLFPEEVEKIEAIKFDPKDVLEGVCAMVESGYDLVISANTVTGGYSIAVRASFTENPNAGKAMYCNAPTVEMAMQVALFKVFTVADGKEWRIQSIQQKPTLS